MLSQKLTNRNRRAIVNECDSVIYNATEEISSHIHSVNPLGNDEIAGLLDEIMRATEVLSVLAGGTEYTPIGQPLTDEELETISLFVEKYKDRILLIGEMK